MMRISRSSNFLLIAILHDREKMSCCKTCILLFIDVIIYVMNDHVKRWLIVTKRILEILKHREQLWPHVAETSLVDLKKQYLY